MSNENQNPVSPSGAPISVTHNAERDVTQAVPVSAPVQQTPPQNGGGTAQPPRTMLSISDIIPGQHEEIKVPLRSRGASEIDAIGYIIFKMNDPKTMRKFRNIYSGGIGSKKTQPLEANNYLLEQKFVRFENVNTPAIALGYESDLQWLQLDSEGQFIAEFAIGEYLVMTQPDTTDLRKS